MITVDEEWLADICKELHLCPDNIFDRYNAVSTFLKAAMMPRGYSSYSCLKMDDVLFSCRMLWLFGCLEMLNKLGMAEEGRKIWREAEGESALAMVYMAGKKSELSPTGHAIRDGMADPLLSLSAMQEAADKPIEYPGVKVEKLYEL